MAFQLKTCLIFCIGFQWCSRLSRRWWTTWTARCPWWNGCQRFPWKQRLCRLADFCINLYLNFFCSDSIHWWYCEDLLVLNFTFSQLRQSNLSFDNFNNTDLFPSRHGVYIQYMLTLESGASQGWDKVF